MARSPTRVPRSSAAVAATAIAALDTLAVEIRREVDAAEADFESAVAHAIRAGELLAEARSQVQHGEWLPWLETNFPGSPRSAQNYMRLAANAEDAQRVAHLGLKGALSELAEPKQLPPRSSQIGHREIAQLEAGIRGGFATFRDGLRTLLAGRGHLALGYASWEAFVATEFPVPDEFDDELRDVLTNHRDQMAADVKREAEDIPPLEDFKVSAEEAAANGWGDAIAEAVARERRIDAIDKRGRRLRLEYAELLSERGDRLGAAKQHILVAESYGGSAPWALEDEA